MTSSFYQDTEGASPQEEKEGRICLYSRDGHSSNCASFSAGSKGSTCKPVEHVEKILGECLAGARSTQRLGRAPSPARARAQPGYTVLPLRPEQPGLTLRLPLPAALTTQAPNRALRATDQDPAASANSRPERPAQDLGFPAPGEEQAQSIVLCIRRQLLIRESLESGNARCVLRAAGWVRG